MFRPDVARYVLTFMYVTSSTHRTAEAIELQEYIGRLCSIALFTQGLQHSCTCMCVCVCVASHYPPLPVVHPTPATVRAIMIVGAFPVKEPVIKTPAVRKREQPQPASLNNATPAPAVLPSKQQMRSASTPHEKRDAQSQCQQCVVL